jgi:hypothetical protein
MSFKEKTLRLLGVRQPDEVAPLETDCQRMAENAFCAAEERNREATTKARWSSRFLRNLADPNVDEAIRGLAEELDRGVR